LNAMMSMAWDHVSLGRYEKSLKIFDQAIRLSPRSPELKDMYSGKAWAYFGLKQYDQAIDWARRAIAAGPSSAGPYQTLAAALALTDHAAEAQDALQHYLALPSNRRAGTIAALKAYNAGSKQSDPRVVESQERSYEGLREAGLPEGEMDTH
jgi:tetratricopeptide (TPR) repeat protein